MKDPLREKQTLYMYRGLVVDHNTAQVVIQSRNEYLLYGSAACV